MKYTLTGGALASLTWLAVGAIPSQAQPIEAITYSIEWDKPAIAPGEKNTATIWATVSPEIGAAVAWNSVPGTGQPGTLVAFALSTMDVLNVANATNGTLSWTVPSFWTMLGKPQGVPDGSGGIKNSNAGQYPVGGPNPLPDLSQVVPVLKLAWVASGSNGPYDVLFATKASLAKVYLDVNLASWVAEKTVLIDGQGGFTVTPAPSAIALAVPLLIGAGWRRRKP